MNVTLDGETLTLDELEDILRGVDGLAMIRGKWVEVDRERLQKTLGQLQDIERRARDEGLSFGEAMRLLAGADVTGKTADEVREGWSQIAAGPWLAETLKGMRQPDGLAQVDPGKALRGTLRPYQRAGVQWLYLLSQLGLGACLADDMGLGKTIQVLSLLLVLKQQAEKAAKSKKPKKAEGDGAAPRPSLLIAPASLLGNWAAEIDKFAPSVGPVHRPSLGDARQRAEGPARRAAGGNRSGHHDLWFGGPPALAERDGVARGDPRRGPGDQEPRRQADQGHQEAQGPVADRPDRHAHREPAERSVVAVRLHQSGPAGRGGNSSPVSSSSWSSVSTTRTARCAIWCGPTSSGD